MLQSSKSFLYTFIAFQLLLNVTFINGAVIRREKRELSGGNVTGITTLNNEVDAAATRTTEEDVGTLLLETQPDKGGITTEESLTDVTTLTDDATTTDFSDGKKEVTTMTSFTVDENTVSFSTDGKVSNADAKVETTVNESTSKAALLEDEKLGFNEETSTAGEAIELSTSTDLVAKKISSALEEDAPTSTIHVDDTTLLDVTTVSHLKRDTTTVNVNDNEPTTQETGKTEDTFATTHLIGDYNSQATDKGSTSPVTDDSISLVTDDSLTFSADIKTIESTTFSTPVELTTTLSAMKLDARTTEPSIEQSSGDITTHLMKSQNLAENITQFPEYQNDTQGRTSTAKFDETTAIVTSTESSDENPIQTTFYANPLLSDASIHHKVKNSNTSSAEKRGKFIDDNYSSVNELRLPNNSDVWTLAGLKSVGKVKSAELQNSLETSDEKAVNNSMVTKNLLDWSRVMSTDRMEFGTAVTMPEGITTEAGTDRTTTEVRTIQENEVEILTTKAPTDVTTEALIEITDRPETTSSPRENEVDTKAPLSSESTTNLDEKTIPERFTTDDADLSTTKSSLILLKGRDNAFIEDNQVDSVEEKPSASPTTTTTTTTSIPGFAGPMKSETTSSSPVNGETTEVENTITFPTSTLSVIDFTTAMPFLTSTMMTTQEVATTTTTIPSIEFNMDDRTNEPPNVAPTLTPPQSSPATIVEPAVTTTTTTTTTTIAATPAVTVMAATTETQTTESEAHTPAIISNDTMRQNANNNYNNYEVVNKTTAKFDESSSIEASEASTRVAPNWSTSIVEVTTPTEVDRLDVDFDVTTASDFDYNSADEILTTQSAITVDNTFTLAPPTSTVTPDITTISNNSTLTTENSDRIDLIHKISDIGETSIESNVIDPLHAGEASSSSSSTTSTTTTTTTTSTTTESSQENVRMQSTGRGEMDSTSTTTTTPATKTTTSVYDDLTTTLQSISTKKEDVYSIVPTIDSGGFHVPKLAVDVTTMSGELASGAGGEPMDSPDGQETDVNVIIAISVSVVGIVALIMLVAFLYVMRKRQKQMSYGQRCRPVSLDAYSLDNVSVYNSVRRKGATLRASKRSYGNVAFDDPSLRHNVMGTHELAKYVEKKSSIWEEFKDVPQIIARADEVPAGCEDKNRYANVIPLPETRVILQQQNNDEKSEYINANYVRGPKDSTNYYIACQAPLETTVIDFWRMIWEQNSRVIIMATDLIENGIDKCAEYLPPSVTLDNHTVFGDFQVTLKNREVKEKYAISTLMLKNTATEESREITHYWYQWPETGVPADEAAIIAMLLEARSSLKLYTIEQSEIKSDIIITDETQSTKSEINGNVTSEKPKSPPKDQGPLTIHCSPGTGRTGTILACDIAMRCLEEPKRSVDIPQIVYSVRRGRASAVQTKEQYEFIYKVTHIYATKISNLNNDN